ncbi:MAG: hypothetical protein ABR613_09945 [Actinomycetota bacterium]
MFKTKLLAVTAAAIALATGPLTAAPAGAQSIVDLPCDAFRPPYDYPCQTAEDTIYFVENEAGDAIDFVFAVRDEAGEIVFRAFCTVFPDHPACQA